MQIDIKIIRIDTGNDFIVQIVAGETTSEECNNKNPNKPEI